ncbi:MAG: hypothetical protein J5770_06640 [Bacteroidaceae bacterium]|nr:hypothetical protein [Bacteroidaceae bacterium]
MNWKRIIFGEPMPDKDDPKYKERYERNVAAGRKFAHLTGISWCAAKIQAWGQSHKVLFLTLAFGVVIFCYVWRIVLPMVNAYHPSDTPKAVAVERVDSAMQHRLHHK